MSEHEQIQRAIEAKRLLEEPLLQEMLGSIEEETLEAWKVSKDRDFREECWKMYRVVEALRQKLLIIAENGELVQGLIERRERREKEREQNG